MITTWVGMLPTVLGASLVGFQACSIPSTELPRPGSCDPFQITSVLPAANSVGVRWDVIPALTFNDFPDPNTVSLASVQLFTGLFYHTGRFWVDLVDRRAFFRPSGRLTPGMGYSLAVRAGIRSLRGCDLEVVEPLPGAAGAPLAVYRFQVAAPGTDHLATPLPGPPADFEKVVAVFAAHCAGAACHLAKRDDETDDGALDDSGACLPTGAGGDLSLCARDAHDAVVAVPSRQVNRQVLVAPGDSSRSYLLRKIIGAPPVVGHVGVPDDDLTHEDQRAIQDWIDLGALPAGRAASAAETDDGGL